MSVFIVLGLIWAAVLVPPVLRARAERRAEFIDSFQEQMGALGSKARAGRALAAEPHGDGRRRRQVTQMKRRRDILGGLLGAMLGSLVLGAFPSLRMVWILHLFLLNVFIGYVALLAHQRNLLARRQPRLARAAPRRRATALAAALHSSR
jgi:uncharacterized membrane protein